eukprot:773259-Rhodomonas_salina.2
MYSTGIAYRPTAHHAMCGTWLEPGPTCAGEKEKEKGKKPISVQFYQWIVPKKLYRETCTRGVIAIDLAGQGGEAPVAQSFGRGDRPSTARR